MTSQQDIRRWLQRGREQQDITHLIVVCDTFDHDDYPVYVTKTQSVREIYDTYNGKNMQRVMEVYSYNHNLEKQLQEHRAYHFD